jgi:hypothetical protein
MQTGQTTGTLPKHRPVSTNERRDARDLALRMVARGAAPSAVATEVGVSTRSVLRWLADDRDLRAAS